MQPNRTRMASRGDRRLPAAHGISREVKIGRTVCVDPGCPTRPPGTSVAQYAELIAARRAAARHLEDTERALRLMLKTVEP
jgi:hypothetical protein